jgi:hypothetical protein
LDYSLFGALVTRSPGNPIVAVPVPHFIFGTLLLRLPGEEKIEVKKTTTEIHQSSENEKNQWRDEVTMKT